MFRSAGVAALAAVVVGGLVRRPGFARRVVPAATAADLGRLRALTAAILCGSVLWEDLARSALLPRELVQPMGVMTVLRALPLGLDALAASPTALILFQAATAAVLGCAAAGWHTRITVPLGALAYLVFGGLLRQYFAFNHAGLVPLLVLALLAATPCGDGFSLDRRQRLRRGLPVVPADVPVDAYAWARWLCWLLIALLYGAAGCSKLRNGGLGWWDATNIRHVYYATTLNPMQFDWQVSLWLHSAPDAVFAAFGLAAVGLELAYLAVPFSRAARRVLPPAMAAFHVAVLFLQNLLFLDLILLQLAFIAPRRPGPPPAPGHRSTVLAAGIAALIAACWTARLEWYPLTAMQMFSWRKTSGVVDWWRVIGHEAGGAVDDRPLAHCLYDAAADQMLLKRALDPARRAPVAAFFARCVEDRNRTAPPPRRLVSIEVQRWRWDFRREPQDPAHGAVADRWIQVVEVPR